MFISMKKLAAAVALVCGTLATGGAQAYQIDLFLSGSSAIQGPVIENLLFFMKPGYVTACDNTSSNCANFFAVKGVIRDDISLYYPPLLALAGKTVRITYRTRGGSVWGVDPVAKATPIQWMDMDSATAGACSAAPTYFSVHLNAMTFLPDQLCAPTGNDDGTANRYGTARVPDLGVSAVEPKMFQTPLNVSYDIGAHAYRSQLDARNLSGLWPATAVFQQVFGIAMTNVIPHDLISSDPALNMFVDRLSFQSMLSKSGLMHDWTKVNGAPVSNINPGAIIKPVVVCRMTQGSGTQAITNYFVNGFGCNAPYVDPSRMADSAGFDASGIYVQGAVTSTQTKPIIIDPSAGYTIVENLSSGDVRSCLAAAQAGANWAFKGDDDNYYQVTFSGAATGTTIPYTNINSTVVAPYGAVGVLSYDSYSYSNLSYPSSYCATPHEAECGWHFHDLNRLLTANAAAIDASNRQANSSAKYAVAAMIEGPWEFFSEVTVQYRPYGPAALSGDLKTLADGLIHVLGDPAFINASSGAAALPNQYSPTMDVTFNKVAKGTKLGDTCKQKQMYNTPQFWN